MTRHDDHGGRPLDGDALDDLLRDWHQSVRDRARDARSLVLEETPRSFDVSTISVEPSTWRTIMTRYTPIAAAIGLVLYLTSVLVPGASPVQQAFADQLVQVPEGGRLAAFDRDGAEIGPCPLQHTDVDVSVSAHVVRVNLVQTYKNPYDTPIEAVYTFPLGENSEIERTRIMVREAIWVRTVT